MSRGFVIAMSAAEVGIEQYVSSKFPPPAGSLAEVPSPPLGTMLRQIAKVPSAINAEGGTVIAPALIKETETHNVLRNKVIHRGKEVAAETAGDAIRHVTSLLHLLDAHAGVPWAMPHVEAPFRWPREPPTAQPPRARGQGNQKPGKGR